MSDTARSGPPETLRNQWMRIRNNLFENRGVEGPADPRKRYRIAKIEDARGRALYLESDGPEAAASARPEKGWMLYELGERGLRVAFFDGLGDRPEGFEPPAGRSEPMFLVLDLVREP